jgi:hypothetical protein
MAVRASNDGDTPRITDQVGKVVAMRYLGYEEEGANDVGPYCVPVAEAMYGLGEAEHPSDVTHVRVLPLFHKVVSRRVVGGGGEWVVGMLIRPGKAYQLTSEAMTDEDVARIDRRIQRVLAWEQTQEVAS